MRSIIFIHIPKTSGTAFFNSIEEAISDYQLIRPKGKKAFSTTIYTRPIFVKGHLPYGYHRYKPFRRFDYISFLRHPIQRAISHYYFVLEAKDDDYIHPEWERHHRTPLKDMFSNEHIYSYANLQPNLQTRMLAGLDPSKGDKAMLEAAKYNLQHRIKAFGIQDEFDRSIELFADVFGWQTKPNIGTKWKRTKNKPSLDSATQLALENAHQLDMELYEFAKKRFEELSNVQ